MEWYDVHYWAVFDEKDEDKKLFVGPKASCYRWARKNGGKPALVILESEDCIHDEPLFGNHYKKKLKQQIYR